LRATLSAGKPANSVVDAVSVTAVATLADGSCAVAEIPPDVTAGKVTAAVVLVVTVADELEAVARCGSDEGLLDPHPASAVSVSATPSPTKGDGRERSTDTAFQNAQIPTMHEMRRRASRKEDLRGPESTRPSKKTQVRGILLFALLSQNRDRQNITIEGDVSRAG
jgi:hypothetical protein